MPKHKIYPSFHISGLIALEFKAELDAEEQHKLDTWLNESEANRQLFANINDASVRQTDLQKLKSFNSAAALAIVMDRIAADKAVTDQKTTSETIIDATPLVHPVPIKLSYRIAAAAAILFILGAGLWFFNTPRHPDAGQDPGHSMYANDIPPGTNKAFLTLANGKVITLSHAKTGVVIDASKLVYSDGTEVRDPTINGRHPDAGQDPGLATNTKLVTASTPRGGTYQVILPDGTKVTLNAASSLRFPSRFTGHNRIVELTGEAYFIVKHNAKQPFRVETKGQIVEDIGTEFNINSYTDENNIKTTLIEGSARVIPVLSASSPRHPELDSGPRTNNGIVLKPGQQSSITNGNIKVTLVDTEEAMAWKNGLFHFQNASLKTVMRQISRWYDVDIEYEGNIPDALFTGEMYRSLTASKVLDGLSYTGVKFRINGRKIIVSK